MATWWSLCLLVASASAALEPRSCLKVTLPRDSAKLLRDLAKNAVQYQININVILKPQLNASLQGAQGHGRAQGEQNSTFGFTNSMEEEFMLGWDKWAWVAGSEVVALNLDFRYKLYSLWLFRLAEHDISVEVDFYPTVNACGSAFENLSSTEKIQEIVFAIKIKVDMILDSEKNKEEKMMMKMLKMLKVLKVLEDKNETCNCDYDAVCGVTKDNSSKVIEKFDKVLNNKSLLCFPALRPYTESKYTYSLICFNSKGEKKFYTKGLLESYRHFVGFLLLPFVPLFLALLWPKSSETEAVLEFEKIDYIHLDDTTPPMILSSIQKLITVEIKKGYDFVGWFRHIFLKTIASTHALIVMGIIDRCFYHEQIERMIGFMKIHGSDIFDLQFWDYIFFINSYFSWSFCYSFWSFWSIFCISVSIFWYIGVIICSRPAYKEDILKFLDPTPYFGFERIPIDVLPEAQAPEHIQGFHCVSHGMMARLGLLFNWKFWKYFFKSLKNILREKRLYTPFKIAFHFFSLLSLFPLFIFFRWDFFINRNHYILNACSTPINILKNTGLIVIVLCSYIVYAYLFLINVYIYVQFLLYIVAATVKHYQLTLTLFGVAAGSIAFLLQIRSKNKKTFLGLKITIFEVAKEIHKENIETSASADDIRKNQADWKCIECPEGQIHMADSHGRSTFTCNCMHVHVPELILQSKDGLPCIPKCMYNMILNDRNPIGFHRLKVLIKMVVMTLFVSYIVMVNQVFRTSEMHEVLQMSEVVVTVGAIILPSIVAGLQTDKETELESMQNRIRIKWLVKNFLKEHCYECCRPHRNFYDYAPSRRNSPDLLTIQDTSDQTDTNYLIQPDTFVSVQTDQTDTTDQNQ